MIFPGMDPYLENPAIWPGIHNRMVVYMADELQPMLRPRYIAAVEERVYLEGPQREIIPDVWVRETGPSFGAVAAAVVEADAAVKVRYPPLEIHESYVTILDRQSGRNVVTVIELLSVTNKVPGEGRDSYVSKQAEVRASRAHLVEIDLLRTGRHVLAVPERIARREAAYDYLVCVNRAGGRRGDFELYPTAVRSRLPRIKVPLAEGDSDVTLDLQAVLAKTYEAGSYRERLRYDEPCIPALSVSDQHWADELLQQAGVRSAPAA